MSDQPRPLPGQPSLRYLKLEARRRLAAGEFGTLHDAQLAVARGIAESFPASGVTVNSVLVGPTESEGVGAFVEGLAAQQGKTKEEVARDFFQHARPSSLLKRFETADEVAAMVVYLCGEPASATTGSAIHVDGGVIRAIA